MRLLHINLFWVITFCDCCVFFYDKIINNECFYSAFLFDGAFLWLTMFSAKGIRLTD